ncbi:hypothetical protein IKP13_05010 [bacterium]|nr:hypothetical protein [bacterium]
MKLRFFVPVFALLFLLSCGGDDPDDFLPNDDDGVYGTQDDSSELPDAGHSENGEQNDSENSDTEADTGDDSGTNGDPDNTTTDNETNSDDDADPTPDNDADTTPETTMPTPDQATTTQIPEAIPEKKRNWKSSFPTTAPLLMQRYLSTQRSKRSTSCCLSMSDTLRCQRHTTI